jgi:hypothetical protein
LLRDHEQIYRVGRDFNGGRAYRIIAVEEGIPSGTHILASTNIKMTIFSIETTHLELRGLYIYIWIVRRSTSIRESLRGKEAVPVEVERGTQKNIYNAIINNQILGGWTRTDKGPLKKAKEGVQRKLHTAKAIATRGKWNLILILCQ